jgi:predicted hotdog family 3-hydroxylacyl-ACP dehydratase
MSPPATLDHAGIAARVPHSGAMCLLAALQAWDAHAIDCTATNHRDANHPLRTRSGLLAACAIEYAAQAMALHGALLGQARGTPPAPGRLASARGVTLHRRRLDDLPAAPHGDDALHIRATRQAGHALHVLYEFTVHHAGQCVAQGRAAVVLVASSTP